VFRLRKRIGSEPTQIASRITVVLTNWKRPNNLKIVLDDLARQTAKPAIFLWNNGAEVRHPAIAWLADSSVNMACWPRWMMAGMAQTDFVCVMDDDLTFTDDRVLDDLMAALDARPEHTIVGLFGMKLDPAKEYRQGRQIRPSDTDQAADIIKGRCMVMRTSALAAVHLRPKPARHALIGDDIFVSGTLAGGKAGMHVVPKGFMNRWKELPGDHGLYKQPDHWGYREQARRHAFSI
jgi:hypothetical protein